MADVATKDNVNDTGPDLTHLNADLQRRVEGQKPMTEAKTDYDALCKSQNESRGYNKKAMNILTALSKLSPEKFEDQIRTLQPGLESLIETRRQAAPGLAIDEKVTPIK